MRIIYISAVCDPQKYYMTDSAFLRQGHAIQKFHYLLLNGLIANGNADNPVIVDALSSIPPLDENRIFEKQIPFATNNLRIDYLLSSKYSALRQMLAGIGTFFRVLTYSKPTAVIIDILKVSASIGAILAARIRRLPCIGIVTDLPEDLDMYRTPFMKCLSDFSLKKQDAYILLAENMKDEIGLNGRKYIVSEGHTDFQKTPVPLSSAAIHPQTVLYAGTLDARYGILTLLDAWKELADIDVRLHIYGGGDVESLVRERAKADDRITYFGSVPNKQVVEAERQATLLVNPRPSNQRFTKYSFPSKTLEYMASGRPVLMTRLPAMPEEYLQYVWTVRDETSTGFAEKIRAILSMEGVVLDNMGLAAQQFVLKEKNSKKQAARILEFIALMMENKRAVKK